MREDFIDTTARTILCRGRQLASWGRVKSGWAAPSVVWISRWRYGAVRQQSGTALSSNYAALFRGRIRLCYFSRYGECVHSAARHVEGPVTVASAESPAVFGRKYTRPSVHYELR